MRRYVWLSEGYSVFILPETVLPGLHTFPKK